MAVLVPGLKPADPTWELYWVRAGGATVVPLGGDDRITVRSLLRGLAPRERRIVYLRYFDGLSQSEIADLVGVSQVHVSRLLRASIERLQQQVGVEATAGRGGDGL